MFLFIVFALVSVVAAGGVILSRRPVYSALFLLLNFATLAAFFVMLQAQYLAAVQVIVYAGAIVVLFLFVVMLIGGGELGDIRPPGVQRRFGWAPYAGLALALLLVAGLGYGLMTGVLSPGNGEETAFAAGSIEAVGEALYTQYALPFELISVLLLVGMIGAVVLAIRE